ncbi:hypothetical protein [Pseudanabaena sp. 'Roaring Creek']|uniref:hypothetical protein n=1 Tax=Pseudanabaena sp. 'Roaring Creek' TaxID=1681830 RepID=UPI0006D7CBA6|nr:hypothetical protein [Pseudanabaena sp. 'Roaring Creek']
MESPIVLPLELFPEMSLSDIQSELAAMHSRSLALDKAMRGEIPIDDYLDLIEFQGYDMDYLVEQCCELPEFC